MIRHAMALSALACWSRAADAGKLAEGFRGIPFGDASVIATPPVDNCSHPKGRNGAESSWMCQTTVGTVPVRLMMGAESGTYYAYQLVVEGYSNASALMLILQEAYGEGTQENKFEDTLPSRVWRDGPVTARWEYNRFSQQGSLMVLHVELSEKIQAERKAAAAKATGDL